VVEDLINVKFEEECIMEINILKNKFKKYFEKISLSFEKCKKEGDLNEFARKSKYIYLEKYLEDRNLYNFVASLDTKDVNFNMLLVEYCKLKDKDVFDVFICTDQIGDHFKEDIISIFTLYLLETQKIDNVYSPLYIEKFNLFLGLILAYMFQDYEQVK